MACVAQMRKAEAITTDVEAEMVKGYSRSQIILHWVTMVFVALQYIFHDYISDAFERSLEGAQISPTPGIASHVIGGGVILILVIWRLSLRLTRGTPKPPQSEAPALRFLSHVVHWGFYVLLVLLPLSGAVAWFGGVEPAAEAHEVLRALLMLTIVLHVAGAVYHRVVLRSGVMERMLRPE